MSQFKKCIICGLLILLATTVGCRRNKPSSPRYDSHRRTSHGGRVVSRPLPQRPAAGAVRGQLVARMNQLRAMIRTRRYYIAKLQQERARALQEAQDPSNTEFVRRTFLAQAGRLLSRISRYQYGLHQMEQELARLSRLR